MKTRLALLLVAFGAAFSAASEPTPRFTAVALSDTADTSRIAVSWRVQEVRDLRKLAARDSRLLGTWSPLPFEERTALRTGAPVADEVRDLLRRWSPVDTGLPVRIDLLSFETWSDPVPGPDPVHALVHLRVVSLDPKRPGLLLEPRAKGEEKLATRAADQVVLLKGLLRDAVVLVKPPFRPSQDTGSAASEPSKWADPASTPAPPGGKRGLGQILSGEAVAGWGGIGAGVRYTQFLEPATLEWTPEYWGGFQLRGPWNSDKYDDVWAGEIQGGMAWHRRLDAGASSFVFVGSAGGLLGIEGSRPVHDDGTVGDRKTFVVIGAEGRALLRWQPTGQLGLSWSAGPQLTLRVPSRLGWFDPALVGEVGWRF